jgi:hypothetical protein
MSISACGRVNADSSINNASVIWINNENSNTFRRLFRCEDVKIINDGEAHALAVKRFDSTEYGCVCFSFGTNIGIGFLDENQELIKALDFGNIDLNMGRYFNFQIARYLIQSLKPKTIAVSGGGAINKTLIEPVIYLAKIYGLQFVNITKEFSEGAILGLSTLFD